MEFEKYGNFIENGDYVIIHTNDWSNTMTKLIEENPTMNIPNKLFGKKIIIDSQIKEGTIEIVKIIKIIKNEKGNL